uniref:Armadillo repeat containing X-linked 1 n=1 Tax=Ursus maritimus TaxID=29073 RepID=A0A452T0Q9_URSMA
MGRTREAGCVAAGVVIGAGACYCVYRLTWGRDENFFALLFLGNYFTKIQIMKLIINFTENPAMTRELVSCKVPSELISLFNKEWDREILLNILTLFENINDNIKSEGLASSKKEFSRSSLFFLFKESGVCVKKIKALANHNDLVVKVKVLKVLTKL